MLECARFRLAHSRDEGDAFFSLVGGDRLRDAELSAQQAQAAALITIAERLDTLIEIQRAARTRVLNVATGVEYETLDDLKAVSFTDAVLVNFTEHGRPCGDDEEQAIVGLG